MKSLEIYTISNNFEFHRTVYKNDDILLKKVKLFWDMYVHFKLLQYNLNCFCFIKYVPTLIFLIQLISETEYMYCFRNSFFFGVLQTKRSISDSVR